jgi:hypothetical protein
LSAPKFIDIDGKRFVWRELLQRRREQLAAAARVEQPALFEQGKVTGLPKVLRAHMKICKISKINLGRGSATIGLRP